MDLKLHVVIVPVSDVDAAKAFYAEKVGFAVDYDQAPDESYRIVQLTPPGSATSIAIGLNLWHAPVVPGATQGLRLVVDDLPHVREQLVSRGVEVTDIDVRPWGSFAWFDDPDGNGWELNEVAPA